MQSVELVARIVPLTHNQWRAGGSRFTLIQRSKAERERWQVAILAALSLYRAQRIGPVRILFSAPVRITCTFVYGDRRRRDVDGPNVKQLLDALVSLGVLADDSDEHIKSLTLQIERGPGGVLPQTRVLIEECPETS